MRDRDIKIVQDTFKKIEPIQIEASEILYDRLFELDPKLRRLFISDLKKQEENFMTFLELLVLGLKRINEFIPLLQRLGQRHVEYGVKDEDYETLREALLYMLKEALGDDFTPEVRVAWLHAYDLIARIMNGAKKQAA